MSFLPPSDVSSPAPPPPPPAAGAPTTTTTRPRARVNLARATARARKPPPHPAATAKNNATANKRKRDSSDEEEEEEEEENEDENANAAAKAPASASSSGHITLSGTSHSMLLAPTAAANGIAANRKKKMSGLFPKSKIKAIMYEDEEVSKMAAVVPLMVSRCVEHFISDLMKSVETQASIDRDKKDQSINFQGKRTLISAQQLKRAILANPKYDFLVDIANAVSDSPSSTAASAAAASSAKQKPVAKKRRVEDDDEEEDEEEEEDDEQEEQQNVADGSNPAPTKSSDAVTDGPNADADLAGF